MNETLLAVLLVAAVGVIVFLLARKQESGGSALQQVNELREALNKSQFEMMKFLAEQLEIMRRSSENTSQAVNREAKDFSQRTAVLTENIRQMHDSVKDLKKFEEVFKAPKARGSWGEASLAHLLGQYYSKELYQLQYQFSSGERADAIFKLPDGRLVSIDAKFPADNFTKMVEAGSDEARDLAEKNFVSDVKARVDEIANKYILPSEKTVDYAIMYVPAEAIYYEIVNPGTKSVKEDITAYALKRRVIITSPNLFYLTMSVIEHWFKDVQFSKQTKEIMKRFEQVRKDADRLFENFSKLGKHLSNAQSAYEESNKRLGMMTDRVDRLISEGGEEESLTDGQDS